VVDLYTRSFEEGQKRTGDPLVLRAIPGSEKPALSEPR